MCLKFVDWAWDIILGISGNAKYCTTLTEMLFICPQIPIARCHSAYEIVKKLSVDKYTFRLPNVQIQLVLSNEVFHAH